MTKKKANSVQELLAEATNPETPAARLAELVKVRGLRKWDAQALVDAVARNPNTDRATLFALAGKAPVAVAENPLLPLLLLESPNLGEEVRCLPSKTRWLLAKTPETPIAILIVLAEHWDAETRAAAATNPAVPLEVLGELFAPANEAFWATRPLQALATNLSAPPGMLASLACDSDYITRIRVAENPSTPRAVLERLAKDERWTVKFAAQYRLWSTDNKARAL